MGACSIIVFQAKSSYMPLATGEYLEILCLPRCHPARLMIDSEPRAPASGLKRVPNPNPHTRRRQRRNQPRLFGTGL
jgi:hypothetical protein